jgi:hypothetical protein
MSIFSVRFVFFTVKFKLKTVALRFDGYSSTRSNKHQKMFDAYSFCMKINKILIVI